MSKRDEYVDKMKAQLDEWNEDIDRLESKLSELTGPARERAASELARAKESYAAGRRKLDEIRGAGEAQVAKLQDEAEHVWKALRQSINYFRSQL